MDSGQDLILALREQRKLLIDTVNAMKVVGRLRDEAEMKYRIALRKEILKLKVSGADEGGGPVAWTVCDDLAKGNEEVAKLRFNRDIKQSDYDVCIEKINAVKIEIRLLENEIKMEWGK